MVVVSARVWTELQSIHVTRILKGELIKEPCMSRDNSQLEKPLLDCRATIQQGPSFSQKLLFCLA
jgi:hypothetical protein